MMLWYFWVVLQGKVRNALPVEPPAARAAQQKHLPEAVSSSTCSDTQHSPPLQARSNVSADMDAFAEGCALNEDGGQGKS